MKTPKNIFEKHIVANRRNSKTQKAAEDENPPRKVSDGAEELLQIRIRILELLARCDGVSKQIDSAFGGQAFLPDLDPLDPANQRRFWAFLHEHRKVTRLLIQALELWRTSFGEKTGLLDF